jgi:hypothetical protein
MERRRSPRRIPDADEPVARARVRTGGDVLVLDVSNCGALVEGVRLLPGTHIDLHIVTPAGRVLVRSRVARSYVAAVGGEWIRYRGAVAFDRLVETTACGYAMPVDLGAAAVAPAPIYPRLATTVSTVAGNHL